MHQFELLIIETLQGFAKNLQPVWIAITFLGDQTFYMLFMPLIYWCVDALIGLRIGVMLMLSGFSNGFLKMVFKSPRPFWISDKIIPGAEHNSFGLPSGHAMNSASIWGWTAHESGRTWVKWLMGILVFLIGFSRVILGAHFISDILLGWLVGLLLIWLFARNLNSLSKNLSKMPLNVQLAMVLLSSSLMVFLPVLIQALSPAWQPPADWIERAGPIDPMNLEFSLTIAGLWLGTLGGFAILVHQKGVLQSNQGDWQKVARYFVGLIGVVALYAGLGALFPDDASLLSMILRYLRYTLIGLWIAWGSPLLFEKLGIGVIKPYLPPQSSSQR
ncbi:MAG: phosphatase PAP2 family protein [Anaerolineaceae bacterium]